MPNRTQANLVEHFSSLEDPRQPTNQEHKFIDIVVIAICAAICGADDWPAVEQFGQAKASWLGTFLELPNGIPSHDTFWRVFRHLDAEQFERCFVSWITSVQTLTVGEVVAIDGKQLRRSHDAAAGKAAIHMVSAWSTANNLVLAQRKVDEKSNEITAIPELLQCLEIQGCLVTTDAMNCQVDIAHAILEQEADYLFALKENHPHMYEDVALLFSDLAQDLAENSPLAYPHDYAKTVNDGHGRIEVRQAWTIADAGLIAALRTAHKWPNLTTLIKVQAERYVGNEHSIETHFYISSASLTAAECLRNIRAYWRIENSLHWVLDIAFREDESRLRKDNGAQNFAILRHIALNLLKQDKRLKVGIKTKRLRAGWDQDYLFSVLQLLFT
jgi:predicted transposase YbfD/YdcC